MFCSCSECTMDEIELMWLLCNLLNSTISKWTEGSPIGECSIVHFMSCAVAILVTFLQCKSLPTALVEWFNCTDFKEINCSGRALAPPFCRLMGKRSALVRVGAAIACGRFGWSSTLNVGHETSVVAWNDGYLSCAEPALERGWQKFLVTFLSVEIWGDSTTTTLTACSMAKHLNTQCKSLPTALVEWLITTTRLPRGPPVGDRTRLPTTPHPIRHARRKISWRLSVWKKISALERN